MGYYQVRMKKNIKKYLSELIKHDLQHFDNLDLDYITREEVEGFLVEVEE